MIKKYLLIILSLAILSGCGSSADPEPDEEILGTWTDEVIELSFFTDETYQLENILDNPLDTANLQFTYGDYYSDRDNKVISFTIRRFELENGTIIDSSAIGPTWVYEISQRDDGVAEMSYQSNTTIGKLYKVD